MRVILGAQRRSRGPDQAQRKTQEELDPHHGGNRGRRAQDEAGGRGEDEAGGRKRDAALRRRGHLSARASGPQLGKSHCGRADGRVRAGAAASDAVRCSRSQLSASNRAKD